MRRHLVKFRIVVLLGLLGALASGAAAQDAGSPVPYQPSVDLSALDGVIVADGSSTVYPITDEAGLQFVELAGDVRMSISFSGTGDGFRKFCDGDIDIQNASRPIQSSEMEQCAANGVDYYAFEIAYDGITVVVHPNNDFVNCLTVSQLEQLWRPEDNADSWTDLDPSWPDETIDLYGPGPASGTFEYFTQAILGEQGETRTDYFPSENDAALVLGVAEDEDGLAYFGFGNYVTSQDELKPVAIDAGAGCVAPSPETIADGSYAPLSRPLFVYVTADDLDRIEVQEFLRFYVANAPRIVTDAGYVPSPAHAYIEDQQKLEAAIAGTLPPDGPN
jgi:phosphate transport system substrate-binding protein